MQLLKESDLEFLKKRQYQSKLKSVQLLGMIYIALQAWKKSMNRV